MKKLLIIIGLLSLTSAHPMKSITKQIKSLKLNRKLSSTPPKGNITKILGTTSLVLSIVYIHKKITELEDALREEEYLCEIPIESRNYDGYAINSNGGEDDNYYGDK